MKISGATTEAPIKKVELAKLKGGYQPVKTIN